MKLKNKNLVICIMLVFTLFYNGSLVDGHTNINAEDYDLIIYTYESLLADPGFDYIGAFANYSGIPKEKIKLVLLEDANTIVTQASLEKENPVADVLIGIDNVLIHTAKDEGILQSYESPTLVNISSELVQNLDPEKYVLPYDYGIIALWYDRSRINTTSTPALEDLTLEGIIENDLDKKLVVEDPTLSSPGLGFLLWTIAVYGDPKINLNGLLDQDWRDWWRMTSDDLRIAPSWGAAFDIYYSESEDRPIMISYGTSPAYDVCHPQWGVGPGVEQPSKAIVTHEQGKNNAWLQIEGIGLVNNAPHEENAKKFIDWFLSTELQDQIPLNQWMYPANKNANVPECFLNAAINPDDVDILNDIISPTVMHDNLDMWKTDWETVIIEGTKKTDYTTFSFIILSLSFVSLAYIITKKKNR
ncbi:MAG: thiamine ABC transporter substrate-binding protein [Candidatus Heimdallarchaeum aukensis]|uniref:Thiamine ABC transporter substrate-binding protein n=1 Tax=Candidatus Heimdallarchaeum aukensis TaxID=2876573 RepID=A0A9Y1FL66_9ARCH|nr:MAG: thiamine ABC transporter substrate-binding protein [Candidatus Heimdallarchaeum aukensis]